MKDHNSEVLQDHLVAPTAEDKLMTYEARKANSLPV